MAKSMTHSLLSVVLLLSILPLAISRHVHHRPLHKHHVRQQSTPTVPPIEESTQTVEPPASFTAGNAAIKDIQAIQDSLSDLPKDLLSFVQAIEHRMEEVEALLQSLISGSPSTPSSSRSPPMPFVTTSTSALPTPNFTSPSTFSTRMFETTLVTATTSRLRSTPKTTSSVMVTRTSRITRTRTITSTSAASASGYFPTNAIVNGSDATPVYVYASGSGFPIYPSSSGTRGTSATGVLP